MPANTAINKIAVIGAGTMGHALALVHALGGCKVMLQDEASEALAKAPINIDSALATLVEAAEIDFEMSQAAKARIEYTSELPAAVADADLVVEAVVENIDVKRQVFAAIDQGAPAAAIIASNTSHLDIFPLIANRRQRHTLIAHWYTPPYIVDLVDIAPGPETTPATIAAVRDLYAGFGKQPLVFKQMIPGYIANRLQAALNLETLRMLDEGWVSASDIDLSIRHGLAGRLSILGHMKKLDYTGLQMVQNGLENRMYQPPEPTGASKILSRLIEEGRTGVQAAAGFYDYGDAPAETLYKQRDLQLLQLKNALKTIERQASDDQS